MSVRVLSKSEQYIWSQLGNKWAACYKEVEKICPILVYIEICLHTVSNKEKQSLLKLKQKVFLLF